MTLRIFFLTIGEIEVTLSMDNSTIESVLLNYPLNVTGMRENLEC